MLHWVENEWMEFSRSTIARAIFIQRQGDLARVFSVIQEGQVEVLVSDGPNDPERVVAVLGKGDFFGNATVFENRPHQPAFARGPLFVCVRPAAPSFRKWPVLLRRCDELLANGATRNSDELWHRLPLAKPLLDREPLADQEKLRAMDLSSCLLFSPTDFDMCMSKIDR